MKRGDPIAALARWLRDEVKWPVSEPTLRSHRRHITDPKTTLVETARRNPAIKRASTQEFLQTLVDIGASKAESDPDSISIDQSIRAAQIIEGRKEKQMDALMTIAQMLMGRPPNVEVIEGEYEVVEPVGTSTPKELATSE